MMKINAFLEQFGSKGRIAMNRSLANLRVLLLTVGATLLVGCGGSSTEVTQNQNTGTSSDAGSVVVAYSGPDYIENFKRAVWDELRDEDKCGACHSETGRTSSSGQSPLFVEYDDSGEEAGSAAIERSYAEFIQLIDTGVISDSQIITKVVGGHNCWLSSDQACGDIMATWIGNMLQDDSTGENNTVQLTAPEDRETGASKNFPDDNGVLFQSTIYPLLEQYCSECHSDTATFAQSPYFASEDVEVAYEAAKSKIDLASADSAALENDYREDRSRMVKRLGNEFHNCWSDCGADARAMHEAIVAFSENVTPTEIDPALQVSKAMRLVDGILANSGGRYEENVIALYEFKAGSGNTAFDTSGVSPAIDLTLSGDYEWVGGWGVKLNRAMGLGSPTNSKKLFDEIRATGEYSVEAWVIPGNVTQEGPAEIIGYSSGSDDRNFTIGQTLYNYNFLNRSSTTNAEGSPALSTADADERLQATQQHIVMTYDGSTGRRIYINGEYTGDLDSVEGGTLIDWDDTNALMIGNQLRPGAGWVGVVKMLAIHSTALNDEQIANNFSVGVGQKFFLLFNVSDLVDLAQSYIVFEVSQFDSYAYLFNAPYFISLDGSVAPDGVPIEGMRIGINGREATVGQSYALLETSLSASSYVAGTGQVLDPTGTIIALEKGPVEDEFFLSFDRIGDNTYARTDDSVIATSTPGDSEYADIGLRKFDEVHQSMAVMTGVSPENSAVKATFLEIEQALPSTESIETFLAAQQMAVTQLAISYCNELVEDSTLRNAFFTGIDLTQSPVVAFNESGRTTLTNILATRMFPGNLTNQPTVAEVDEQLDALVTTLSNCSGGCDVNRSQTIAKAACAAVMGSAVMMLQ